MSQKPIIIDKRPSYDQTPAEPKPFTAIPLGDYIVVRRIEKQEGTIVLADIAKEIPEECEVIAVSHTVYAVAAGDKVLVRRYSGTEIEVDKQPYTAILIQDVLLKL